MKRLAKFEFELEKIIKRSFDPIESLLPIVVGVSGGEDSVALISSLSRIFSNNLDLIYVAHLNHNLRVESSSDQVFVQELASRLGIKFFTKSVFNENNQSVESWGREQRYIFFNEVLEATGSKFILTAHHKSDQAENVFMRIVNGRGLSGSLAIPSIDRERKIFRPFIEVTKSLISTYVRENKIPFINDQSNFSPTYFRNRVRNDYLPQLKKENPSIEEALVEFGYLWDYYRNSKIEVSSLEELAELDEVRAIDCLYLMIKKIADNNFKNLGLISKSKLAPIVKTIPDFLLDHEPREFNLGFGYLVKLSKSIDSTSHGSNNLISNIMYASTGKYSLALYSDN